MVRSRVFSQITASHRSLRDHECYSELFDLYFDTLYEGYNTSPYLRDLLLIMIAGLNLFRYHIVKLNVPYQYYYVDCPSSRKEMIYIGKFPANLGISFTYDCEMERVGIFHLPLPTFQKDYNKSETDSLEPVTKIVVDEEEKSNLLLSRGNKADTLSYSPRYIYVKQIGLKFSIESINSSGKDKIEEIFSQL